MCFIRLNRTTLSMWNVSPGPWKGSTLEEKNFERQFCPLPEVINALKWPVPSSKQCSTLPSVSKTDTCSSLFFKHIMGWRLAVKSDGFTYPSNSRQPPLIVNTLIWGTKEVCLNALDYNDYICSILFDWYRMYVIESQSFLLCWPDLRRLPFDMHCEWTVKLSRLTFNWKGNNLQLRQNESEFARHCMIFIDYVLIIYWFIMIYCILILHCLACPCYWLIWFNVVLRRIAMSIGEFQWNTSWTLLAGGPHTLKGKGSGHQLSLLSLRSSTEHFLWHATFAKRADWEMSGKSRPGPDMGTKRDKLCVDVEIVLGWFALISGANFRVCKILQRVGSWTPPWVAHCYKHRDSQFCLQFLGPIGLFWKWRPQSKKSAQLISDAQGFPGKKPVLHLSTSNRVDFVPCSSPYCG